VVLKVCAHTGGIGDDGDLELLQFRSRTNTAKLEKLGRVVCSTCDDDFTRRLDGTGYASSAAVLGAGLIEVLTVQELYSSSARRTNLLVESDLSNVAVHPDIERVHLRAVGKLGIANLQHKLAGSSALAIGGGERYLVKTRVLVAGLAISIGVASNQGSEVDDRVGLVAESKRGTTDQAQKLRITCNNVNGGVRGSEPTVVAVAWCTREKVMVVLELLVVLAHVLSRPRVVSGEGRNVVEVRLGRIDCNKCVVGSAATEGTSTRVESALHLGARGWAETSVLAAIRGVVYCLEVESLSLVIGVMTNEEVPGQAWVFRHLGVESRNGVVDVGTLVIASFDQERLVTSERKASCQRLEHGVSWCVTCGRRCISYTTTCSGTNNDIFIAGEVDCLSERNEGCDRAQDTREKHDEM
jgi:hypothetical protein